MRGSLRLSEKPSCDWLCSGAVANLSTTLSRSSDKTSSFSIEINARFVSLSCPIGERIYVFTSFKVEKDLSQEALHTGKVIARWKRVHSEVNPALRGLSLSRALVMLLIALSFNALFTIITSAARVSFLIVC